MTPEELDLYLRTPEENELLYLKGRDDPKLLSYLDNITLKGKKIHIYRPPENAPIIYAAKHSRFYAYPVHSHCWVELNYMYSGSCVQKINGKEVELQTGQVLLMDEDSIHEIPILGENDILLNVYISKKYLNAEFFNRISQKNLVSQFLIDSIAKDLQHDFFMKFDSENRRRLPMFIKEFFCEFYAPSECSSDILNSFFILILTELIQACRITAMQKAMQAQENSVLPVLKYIETHYKTITLSEAAAFFNMNPDYLSKLLKSKTGSSFQTLILQQRMNTARQLLINSTMSVSEIAHTIGYNNVTFFYKKFKENFDCLPGEYREDN